MEAMARTWGRETSSSTPARLASLARATRVLTPLPSFTSGGCLKVQHEGVLDVDASNAADSTFLAYLSQYLHIRQAFYKLCLSFHPASAFAPVSEPKKDARFFKGLIGRGGKEKRLR